MKEKYKIALLPGDGIGPEVVREAVKILKILESKLDFILEVDSVPVGGAGYEATGHPLPEQSLTTAKNADAILLGAVGGGKCEKLDFSLRPERALLGLRSSLKLYANLRPAKIFSALVEASTLKRDVVEGLDILVVRELTGGIYFGEPRGVQTLADGTREGRNTLVYTEAEIERI
ncbi:MAG: isocitrate/isopropylmalate family dehydrogenase, partial [Nitrospinales bacterium]